MKPDFDELVGSEGSSDELDDLRHVHELLVSASPPPTPRQPRRRVVRFRSRVPRGWAISALSFATTVTIVIAVGLGYALRNGNDSQAAFTRPMHGVGSALAASALIKVGGEDANGNRPLRMSVRSLPALAKGRWYELYLTKKGKAVVPCGTFQTGRTGSAQVSMNAPADLAEYDGWIVTARMPGQPVRVLLST